MFPITPFCFSTILLDHGDSAAVVLILMFNCLPISLNNSLLNSSLSERKRLGVSSNIAIQCLKILLITFFCFERTMAAGLYLVAWSTMCRIFHHVPNNSILLFYNTVGPWRFCCSSFNINV